MQRSEINQILRQAASFIHSFGYIMPPFADWTPETWHQRYGETEAIRKASLGWDITDYGLGKFDEVGLFLFTVRNGNEADLAKGMGMLYAEKIMISRKDQLSPMHFHKVKAEDIINRGGGQLVIELFQSTPDGSTDPEKDVTVYCDGIARTVKAGGKISLGPGESVTLLPGVYHAFWGEKADVLIGEVSTVNNDLTDNYFRDKVGRFPSIVEDEAPYRLLVGDYAKLA